MQAWRNGILPLRWESVLVLSPWSPCAYCIHHSTLIHRIRNIYWQTRFSIFIHNRHNHHHHHHNRSHHHNNDSHSNNSSSSSSERRRRDRNKPKKSPSERRLRKLDAESPTCTLEEWWSRTKVPAPPVGSEDEADGAEGEFIWYTLPISLHIHLTTLCCVY